MCKESEAAAHSWGKNKIGGSDETVPEIIWKTEISIKERHFGLSLWSLMAKEFQSQSLFTLTAKTLYYE